MKVCRAAAIFSLITTAGFKIAAESIRKRKMIRYCAWMNDLESYSSFARKLLIKCYIKGALRDIDLSDIGLDCVEVNRF